MGVIETYSKRKKKELLSGKPNIYKDGPLPLTFKNQVKYIWRDSIGVNNSRYTYNRVWKNTVKSISKEHGLAPYHGTDYLGWCESYLDKSGTDQALDLIELTFKYIHTEIRENFNRSYYEMYKITQSPDNAIEELNSRFQEHSLGYQFANGQIIKSDSLFIHKEVTLPMLKLIHEAEFSGVEEEFMKAHKHYRDGEYKTVLVESLKALESTLKSICDLNQWKYEPDARFNGLVSIVFEKGLVPLHLKAYFNNLKEILKVVPSIRNKGGGHGQGREISFIPKYLASHMLHLTASTILFLIEANKEEKRGLH